MRPRSTTARRTCVRFDRTIRSSAVATTVLVARGHDGAPDWGKPWRRRLQTILRCGHDFDLVTTRRTPRTARIGLRPNRSAMRHQKDSTTIDVRRPTSMPVGLLTCIFTPSAVLGPAPNSVHTEDVVGNAQVRSFSARPYRRPAEAFLVAWSIANIRSRCSTMETPETGEPRPLVMTAVTGHGQAARASRR